MKMSWSKAQLFALVLAAVVGIVALVMLRPVPEPAAPPPTPAEASPEATTSTTAADVSTCAVDDAIDASLSKAAVDVVQPFVAAVLKGDATSTYPTTSKDLRAVTGKSEKRYAAAIAGIAADGPYTELALVHMMHPTMPAAVESATCDYPGPDGGVRLGRASAQPQMFFLYSAKSKSGTDVSITVPVARYAEGWQVDNIQVHTATMAGRNSRDLLAQSQAEAAKGHALNAYYLLAAAVRVSKRGWYAEFGFQRDLEAAMKTAVEPDEFRGEYPLEWPKGDAPFWLKDIRPTGIDGKLGILLVHDYFDDTAEQPRAAAEAANKRLVQAFAARHSTYKDAFAFVAARAINEDERVAWTTRLDAATGAITTTEERAGAK